MICSNCGFQNQPGDEFCGSCGQFLEWTGKPSDPTEPAAAIPAGTGPEPLPPPPTEPPPSSPTPPPSGPTPPPPSPSPAWTAAATKPAAAGTGFANLPPDVICWNCGRRNPPGRSFCIQCGERLTTDASTPAAGTAAAGAAAAGGVGGGDTTDDGGRRGRIVAAIAGLIVLLLVIGVVAAAFLGGGPGPTATPTGGAVISPTPNGPTGSISSPSSSASATVTSPPPTGTAVVTASPSPSPTPRRTRRPTPPPTPTPTPLNCAASAQATRSITLDQTDPDRVLGPERGWCVDRVTFTNTTIAGATVKLKLYLINDGVFTDFPQGYRYGWLEVTVSQPGNYDVQVSYPPSYMDDGLEPLTTIEFAIEECTAAPGFCGGSVEIRYEPGPPPAP